VPHPYTKDKNIVEGISFEVKRGEILGIAGLVGAGRSELVNSIFGIIKKTGGKIFVEKEEINIRQPQDAIKNGIALLTEERKANGLIGILTIKQNITIASLNLFSKQGWIRLKKEEHGAQEYFEKISIKAPGLQTLVEQLSGGNQQKVVLSKWLMRDPRILIMDEPTRGIDVGAKYEIYKIMTQLVLQGIAIIMISSELPELISMSDRIIVLANGKIQGELAAAECTQEQVMMMATNAVNSGETEMKCGDFPHAAGGI
jgi:ABC-type sugar transport system ATPase subunit